LHAKLRVIEDLPGPWRLPLLGNLHQMDTARMHRSMERWSEQFGPFFRFQVGHRRIIGVADPGAIGTILRDRPDGFRRTQLLETVLDELGVGGVFAANGSAWRAQRKMVMSAFDTRHLKNYFPALSRVTERLYRRWSAHAASGVAFDLQTDLMRFTVDVIAGLAFGVDCNTIESEGETIQTHLNHVFPMLNRRLSAPFPYWRWLRLPADRALDRHLAVVHLEVAALIAKARERLAHNPSLKEAPENLIEAMLIEREAPGTRLTDRELAGNVLTMLLAGEDTTANTLAWLIYLASSRPSVMRRLSDEALDVLGPAPFAERLDQVSALNFTAATAHETMRLKPVAPIILLQANEPKVIGDLAIPGGTVVAALMRGGSMDERYFARPQTFEPERWLGPAWMGPAWMGPGFMGPEGSGTPSTSRERISMPFGAGPRICPGRNLALLEISMVTSMLARNFDVIEMRTADGAQVDEWLSFTMAPSKLLVTLARRRSTPGPAQGMRAG